MKFFLVLLFDQNLIIVGVVLVDDKVIFGSFCVVFGDVIMLQVDEFVEDFGVLQDLMNVLGVLEVGFKGMGFLGK